MHSPQTPASDTAPIVPYVPASQSLPEITIKAVVLGFVLSAVLAGANAYLGLKVGLTVSASIPAAVISMAVLRMFKTSNILENNIVQTAASAGESLAAGVIFTLPALVMLGFWQGFNYIETTAIAMVGGVLGVLFTVPLRRALIIEARLKFPEGVATGEVLKAGTEGGKGVRYIAMAGIGAAIFKVFQTGFKLAASSIDGAITAGRSVFGFGSDLSVALMAVGYIIGLNIATLVFAGGLISWLFGIPIFMALATPETVQGIVGTSDGYEAALAIWSKQVRFLGVGAMATGGIYALFSLVGPIRDGVRSSLEAVRASRGGTAARVPRTEQDAPINIVMIGALVLTIPLFIVFTSVVQTQALDISTGLFWSTVALALVFAYVAGFLFSSVAGYMAGLVGSSNNPISGVTIATVLSISLVLFWILGTEIDFSIDTARATRAAATAILVGAVVCCAASIAGDNMQDLKAGQLVGATPYKQQIMQMIGVVAGALVIAPVLSLLFQAYGLGDVFPRAGMDAGEALQAPQATLMSSVANGVFTRNLPWTMIALGVLVAVAIIVIDRVLEARGSSFRAPVLAVAVGIYLPLELSTAIFIGGLAAFAVSRFFKNRKTELGDQYDGEVEKAGQRGLLFASGLITGEALVGILLAIPFAIAESTDVLRIPLGLSEGAYDVLTHTLGLGAFLAFVFWLYRVAVRRGD